MEHQIASKIRQFCPLCTNAMCHLVVAQKLQFNHAVVHQLTLEILWLLETKPEKVAYITAKFPQNYNNLDL